MIGALPVAATTGTGYANVSTGMADGPLAATRRVLERSGEIVRGPGERKEKLLALNDVLRGFLDTDALAQVAAGKHLDGKSSEERTEFMRLFRELFVRTYVQRLLLFDAPQFAYGDEQVSGETATVATEIVTPGDRFAVDYSLRRAPEGWRATDIKVEQVSLAQNFRAQFDSALAKSDFEALLDTLRKKLDGPQK